MPEKITMYKSTDGKVYESREAAVEADKKQFVRDIIMIADSSNEESPATTTIAILAKLRDRPGAVTNALLQEMIDTCVVMEEEELDG